MRRYAKLIMTVGVLVCSLSLFTGCFALDMFKQPKDQSAEQAPDIKAIKAQKVARQQIADPVEVPAEVQSPRSMNIVADTGGEVEQLYKKRGEMVKEGETIARLSSKAAKEDWENALFAVNNAKSAISQARKQQLEENSQQANMIRKKRLNLEELNRAYNKMKNDYDVGAVTKDQLHEMELVVNQSRIDYELAQQNSSIHADSITELKLQLADAETALQEADIALKGKDIKSPLSGIIVQLPVTEGMSVSPGTPVAQVVMVDPIRIKTFLNEEATKYVIGKSELTYYLPENEQSWEGKISFLANVMDPEMREYELNLEVPNSEYTLKPGMKVMVQLTRKSEQIVLAIPQRSVLTEAEGSFVFITDGDTVEKRKVQLGRSNDMYYEVISGVKEGELIVVSGHNQLTDKEKIQWKE